MPRACAMSAGRTPTQAQQPVRHERAERVGDRLPQRGREVVALARVVHDVDRPHVPALVHEPVVPVVDEVPAEDRGAERERSVAEVAARTGAPTSGRRVNSDAHVVVIATPPVTTDATPPADATLRAARPSFRRRTRLSGSMSATGSASARRAIRSAIVVTATAPIAAVATSALPYLPLPGVNGASTRGTTIGATRLATPMVRLVIVSRARSRPPTGLRASARRRATRRSAPIVPK